MAYRHQYFVTERYYIEALRARSARSSRGEQLNFDWTTPGSVQGQNRVIFEVDLPIAARGRKPGPEMIGLSPQLALRAQKASRSVPELACKGRKRLQGKVGSNATYLAIFRLPGMVRVKSEQVNGIQSGVSLAGRFLEPRGWIRCQSIERVFEGFDVHRRVDGSGDGLFPNVGRGCL